MFDYFVYIIKGINDYNKTKFYIGFTNNLYRRIKQHNREIKGGAKATYGYKWEYCVIITNFKNNIEGLQIEWRVKHSTKKTGIINKINSFLLYIDQYNKVSPKANILNKKLLFYIDNTLLPKISKKNIDINKSILAIFINVKFELIIIDHLMNKIIEYN